MLCSSPKLLRIVGTIHCRFVSRFLGQPTSHTHPHLLQPGEVTSHTRALGRYLGQHTAHTHTHLLQPGEVTSHTRALGRYLGQPTAHTHPHLVRPGEVTSHTRALSRYLGQLTSHTHPHLVRPGEVTSHTRALSRYLGQPTSHTHPHLVQPGEVTSGIRQEEFHRRRSQLMSAVTTHHGNHGNNSRNVVIVVSSPVKFMAVDVPYPFRQDPNFLYLSGFKEPNSVLVLESCPGEAPANHRATLLVPERNPDRELWDGPRSGTDGALTLTGVDKTLNIDDLGSFLAQFRSPDCTVWFDQHRPVHRALHDRIHAALIQPRTQHGKPATQQVGRFVQQLRLQKSPSELRLMERAADIAAQAFVETMRFSFPGMSEAQLQGRLDFECRMGGADMLAYPPVVAGSNRANTLHYISNNQVINSGELVLVDAGCEYHGYVCDITRTWPISGRFTEPQRQLYEAVLSVQKTCLRLCRPEISLDHIYTVMLTLIGEQLQGLGIIQEAQGYGLTQAARKYCPHHISHYLGMDVHDTPDMSRASVLQPGMVVTVEPGIYIREDDVSAPPEFRGIGIRVEDDVLITEGDPEVLTRRCPKEVAEIEQLMA